MFVFKEIDVFLGPSKMYPGKMVPGQKGTQAKSTRTKCTLAKMPRELYGVGASNLTSAVAQLNSAIFSGHVHFATPI